MMKDTLKYMGVMMVLLLSLASCTKKWEDHFGNTSTQKNLYELISENSDFSAFTELLNKSGYAESLKASKNYTLIIPTNAAMAAVKADYDFTDTAVVKSFVGYHIINSIYNVNTGVDTVKALNMRNKYVEFTHGEFDGVVSTKSNVIASNGIYHVVGQPLKPLQNIFNLLMSKFAGTKQVEAIASFDTVYREGETIMYHTNPVWISEVRRNMTTENRKYTYFVVDDESYEAEYAKLKPYYTTAYEEGNTTRPDSTTTFFTKKAVLRDFMVEGDLSAEALAAGVVSITGTAFQLNPADIISRTKTSNGAVYRVRHLTYKLSDQIKEIKVLGVEPRGYKQNDKRGNIFFRDKRDMNGVLYQDIEIYNHGVTSFYAKYRALSMNVGKYKVYGRAIMGLAGDPQTVTFTQYIHFLDPSIVAINEPDLYKRPVLNSAGNVDTRMAFEVQPLNPNEVYLGEVTQDVYGNMQLLVMCNGTGPIILEYLRFVPIIQ